MAKASSTTARSNSGERGSTPNGALTASTLGRMWCAPLKVTFIACSRVTKCGQRGSASSGVEEALQRRRRPARRGAAGPASRQIVEALAVRAQVAALARAGAVAARRWRRRPAARPAAWAGSWGRRSRDRRPRRSGPRRPRRRPRGRPARWAPSAGRRSDRSSRRDRLVEVGQDGVRGQLDHPVLGAAVLGDQARPGAARCGTPGPKEIE